jgi:hypothetical protein
MPMVTLRAVDAAAGVVGAGVVGAGAVVAGGATGAGTGAAGTGRATGDETGGLDGVEPWQW